jgi:hypothetical protein
MVIRRASEKKKIDVDALIDKGAKVREDSRQKNRVYISLGMPEDMLIQIDECVSNRVGIVRTGWILEAIHEKILKERNT